MATKAERGVIDRMSESAQKPVVLLDNLTLPEIAAIASKAAIFVGNDSGIAHIASAVGTPSVVIFGSSNRNHWHPWTDARNEIVYNELPCQPCAGYVCEKFGEPKCILDLNAENVIDAVDRVLSSERIPANGNTDPISEALKLRTTGKIEEAKRILKRTIVEVTGEQKARATRELAEVERNLRNQESAIEHYRDAVLLYGKLDLPLRLAHTIRHLGDVLFDSGDFSGAVKHQSEALEIYRNTPNRPTLDLANALNNLAISNSKIGDIARSKEFWREARDLYAELGITEGVEQCERELKRP